MKKEYVITILGDGKRRRRRGRVGRFGRSEYLSRRGTPQETVAPYFISFNSAALQPGQSRTYDFGNTSNGDWYWLRPDDILMVFTYSVGDVSVNNGFSTLVSGRCSVFWRRWQTGNPTNVTVTMADTEEFSQTIVRFVTLRNAQATGTPFTFNTSSGSGLTATFPSIAATTEDLVITTHQATGIYDGLGEYPSGQFQRLWSFFADSIPNSSTFRSGMISAGIVANNGTVQPLEVVSTADEWSTLTMAIKPCKPLKRVLAGPHVGTNRGSGERPPFILPKDIVVTYVISASAVISVPSEAGDGWEHVPGSPVQSGSNWLHIYWKRWTDDDSSLIFMDYSTLGFLKLYSVARGARSSGNPFGSFSFTTGSGTSIAGPSAASSKNDLAFFTAVAKFSASYRDALGLLTATGAEAVEVDNDSYALNYFTNQYRTSSGYATGASVGPFTMTFNRSAVSSWGVTFTVKK